MDEDELRELQDPASWEYEDARVLPPVPDAGGVAVRFAADEFERVAQQAPESGMTLAAFVREAVLERVAQRVAR